ncbi:MAG TPA: SDR family NAD(P)-dependent oxidoreductase [Caulobacteraceae bacterium]|nr:SDR family NAD(P)-dependent oxidoreductase [Caulobacteraceae bacterium]
MSKVIITGGFGALGSAVTLAFTEAGHAVALIDRATAPDSCVWPYVDGVDLTDPSASETAFQQARATLGGADVLVNVAGSFTFELVSGSAGAWDAMFRSNLLTCANMCRAALSALSDGGAIVNVGAAAAEKAGAGMGPYAASKAGVARLTESLAAELAGRIRVNAVLPLIMDTPQNRAEMPGADPLTWTSPAAVADAIVFLASGAARAVNGVLLPVTAPSRP